VFFSLNIILDDVLIDIIETPVWTVFCRFIIVCMLIFTSCSASLSRMAFLAACHYTNFSFNGVSCVLANKDDDDNDDDDDDSQRTLLRRIRFPSVPLVYREKNSL